MCPGTQHWPPRAGVVAFDWRWSRTAPLHATWSWCCWAGQAVSVAHPARTTSSAPRCNHGGGGRSASATLPFGEHLGFPSSLPLLYTMMCSSQCNSCFFFFCSSPLAVTASYGLVLCMLKFTLGRIAPLFASLLVVTAHYKIVTILTKSSWRIIDPLFSVVLLLWQHR
jgi:hypothetical protein